MTLPDTRHSLILRLQNASDAAAWMEFCEIYEATTYRIARRFGFQDADAREVTQEVLLQVSRKICNFDIAQDGRFRGWLSCIARNIAIDQLRKRQRTFTTGSSFTNRLPHLVDSQDELSQFDYEARRQQFLWAANQVRRQVSPQAWQAFWLTAVEGTSGDEVARKLTMSVGAVYVARSRVLARVKKLLAPYRENET